MLERTGLLFAFAIIMLQLAVNLQPLLPEKLQIAPVCLSVTHNLLSAEKHQHVHETHHELMNHLMDSNHHHDHNHFNHQCQYCTVYADVVLSFKFGIDEVIDKIQIKLSFYKASFRHIYFSLQRLYLLPQGRAPPIAL